MHLFDTHVHLDDPRFAGDLSDVMQNMKEAGVSRCITIGADLQSSQNAVSLAGRYDNVWASVGVHPHEAEDYMSRPEEAESLLTSLCKADKVVAFGEIGLDYYYDNSPRQAQRDCFERQLAIAAAQNLPVILHIRDAHGEALDILKAFGPLPAGGVVHCYTGSPESAEQYLSMGLYIALGGAVTFKNARKLLDVAAMVPADRLVLETDCPYLAPEPMRGKRNEPAFVAYTAKRLAEIRGVSPEELAYQTFANACRLFRIF